MYWNDINYDEMMTRAGWIVTLDVLKYFKLASFFGNATSWIVTLDVLKFKTQTKMIAQIHSWIVTLDVLKSQRVLT